MDALDRDALQVELKKKKICRFCLSQDHTKITNIYMRDTRIKSSAPLPIQIMAIASIEVFSTDDMPCYVCSDCTNMFEFSYQFKQMCKKADNLLRQFPLTGKWPEYLEKPILMKSQISLPITTPSGKYSKTTQVRMQHTARTSVQQESLLLPKKILNSSLYSDIPLQPEQDADCTITFLDKIENNDELSLDDIHQLVAAEDIIERECVDMDNIPMMVVPENQHNKPKVLNKSSIRILNKDAETENEPRLSYPKIKQDVDGKTEIVAEILNVGDEYEVEPDPTDAAVIETNVFPCDYCERSFPLLQLRDIHMKNHLRDRKFQCDYCEKSFFSKYDLQRHLFIHSGEKPYKCSVCEQGFSRSSLLTRHEKTHTDIPKYICVHCERAFLLKADLDMHVEKHKINRPFVCKICNKRFAFKQGVERHEVVHSRQQPYSCQYCGESFSTTSKLSRHLTAHAGLRPYPCKYCKKSYLLSHHLTRHLRSHNNVDAVSFMCSRCNANFPTRDDLIHHSTTHANELNLACPLCKDIFDNMIDLTSHIKDHSEGEAYACEFCDLIFITPEKLQSHTDLDHIPEMETYHTDDNARSDNQSGNNKNQINISDEKLQNTVNEFLGDEVPDEGNDSDNTLTKDIKKEVETQSPKVINQIVIQSQDAETGDQSLLIPLKQRKLDLPAKKTTTQPKKSPRATQSPVLKRKTPTVRGTPAATRDSNQPNIQSLLKFSQNVTISKTTPPKQSSTKKASPTKIAVTKTTATKTPTSKTPLSKTPPTKTVVPKKMVLTDSLTQSKIIKVESEHPEASSSSPQSVNEDISKTKIGKKKVKVQKITVTKAQAAAMVKEGRIKIEDGKIILKK